MQGEEIPQVEKPEFDGSELFGCEHKVYPEDCMSCDEGDTDICVEGKRGCSHHCNHIWTHDVCCWCGETTPEDDEIPLVESTWSCSNVVCGIALGESCAAGHLTAHLGDCPHAKRTINVKYKGEAV